MRKLRNKIIAGKFTVSSSDYDKWKGHFLLSFLLWKHCWTELFQKDFIVPRVRAEGTQGNDINDRDACRKTGKFISYIRNRMKRCKNSTECDFCQ
jgi:hypothetical protein